MLLSGEWRWIPSRMALDMAFFYDTGMVAPRLDAITFGSFVSDFGVGMRFHSPTVTPLRIEFATGSEGLRIVFAASSAF
jgi:outer membrane translocation and assembly module TamA